MKGITIHDYFGYEIPMKERYELIRDAGFNGVMLGWAGYPDNPHETKRQNPELVRNCGLYIENLHAPFENVNSLWTDSIKGDTYYKTQLSCLEDCAQFEIPTMVLHVSGGENPPPLSEIGLLRLQKLVQKAEQLQINIAIENLRRLDYLRFVFDNIKSPLVKFCFDAGHWHCRTPDEALPGEFGDKLAVLHLHDNDGGGDQHLLPFDGTIDWAEVIKKISATGYSGNLGIEVVNTGYEHCTPSAFLQIAYERAARLWGLI